MATCGGIMYGFFVTVNGWFITGGVYGGDLNTFADELASDIEGNPENLCLKGE